jgi:hypothetical protein
VLVIDSVSASYPATFWLACPSLLSARLIVAPTADIRSENLRLELGDTDVGCEFAIFCRSGGVRKQERYGSKKAVTGCAAGVYVFAI